jgi:hypothetical protein
MQANAKGASKKGKGKASTASKVEPPPKNYVDAESVYWVLCFFFCLGGLTMQLAQIISE